jgi:osmotically-inducible protein OsmY
MFVWRDGAFPAVFAVVAAALASACATAPPESPAQERIDAATAERIYAALDANPVFYFRDVDVSVDDGVAYLGGYVWTTDALFKAQRIARNVPGVTRVVDDMKLEREGLRGGGDGGGAQ